MLLCKSGDAVSHSSVSNCIILILNIIIIIIRSLKEYNDDDREEDVFFPHSNIHSSFELAHELGL